MFTAETQVSLVITLYGISNCDTIRKARKWLNAAGIEYRFHDYRKEGLDKVSLQNWSNELGWEALLNRRGTTWRQLPEAQKASIDEASAIELMLEQPAMIKRPLLDTGSKKVLGFSDKQYQALFQ
nr:ArsC family reductase [Endozoicomonas sp. ISHI1]